MIFRGFPWPSRLMSRAIRVEGKRPASLHPKHVTSFMNDPRDLNTLAYLFEISQRVKIEYPDLYESKNQDVKIRIFINFSLKLDRIKTKWKDQYPIFIW